MVDGQQEEKGRRKKGIEPGTPALRRNNSTLDPTRPHIVVGA